MPLELMCEKRRQDKEFCEYMEKIKAEKRAAKKEKLRLEEEALKAAEASGALVEKDEKV